MPVAAFDVQAMPFASFEREVAILGFLPLTFKECPQFDIPYKSALSSGTHSTIPKRILLGKFFIEIRRGRVERHGCGMQDD